MKTNIQWIINTLTNEWFCFISLFSINIQCNPKTPLYLLIQHRLHFSHYSDIMQSPVIAMEKLHIYYELYHHMFMLAVLLVIKIHFQWSWYWLMHRSIYRIHSNVYSLHGQKWNNESTDFTQQRWNAQLCVSLQCQVKVATFLKPTGVHPRISLVLYR